jgi:hypothetical protein
MYITSFFSASLSIKFSILKEIVQAAYNVRTGSMCAHGADCCRVSPWNKRNWNAERCVRLRMTLRTQSSYKHVKYSNVRLAKRVDGFPCNFESMMLMVVCGKYRVAHKLFTHFKRYIQYKFIIKVLNKELWIDLIKPTFLLHKFIVLH